MLKCIEIEDFRNNLDYEFYNVIKSNMPLIINNNKGKNSLVLLSFKSYNAIERLFDSIDYIQLSDKKNIATCKKKLDK